MSVWKEYRLEDIVTFQRGHDLPKSEMIDGEYPVAGSNGIIGYHNKFTTKGPGVTIGRSGNIGGQNYYESDYWAHNTVLYVKEFKKAEPKFFYYFLKTLDFSQFNAGSAVPTLNRNHIHELLVTIPDIPEQRAIASILSSLDDKIDLLHRQNKTLEQLAETLFRQWFVEEADESWKIGKLGDVLESIESGSRPKGGIDPNLQNGIPSIGAENINGIGYYDYSKTKFIKQEFFESMKKGIIQSYDVLIYKDGAYIGRKSMFGKGFPFEICTVNEHVFILRTNSKINQFFLYFLLQQNEMEQLNTNSAQPGLNQEAMKSLKIVIPSFNLIEKYGQLTKVWIDKIFFNCNQIRTLTQLRDILLPKLMSGEVSLNCDSSD